MDYIDFYYRSNYVRISTVIISYFLKTLIRILTEYWPMLKKYLDLNEQLNFMLRAFSS
jgi:hypothetical protein